MSWLQVHMRLGSTELPAVELLLEELGALSLTLMDAQDQPIFEPAPGEIPLWDNIKVTALFEADTDAWLVRAALDSMESVTLHEWSQEALEDEDWERNWMARFEPMRFGDNLWIVPTWHEAPQPQAVNISLDPGLAFGSGTHETTSLCLDWLSNASLQGKDVLDFGCGSGILAIAALLLGAKHADGVDIDPQALIASRDNADKNNIPAHRFPLFLPADAPEREYELVVANILSGPLIGLVETLATRTQSSGKILLSGILRDQAQMVRDAYQPWFDMDEPVYKGDWTRLTGTRRNTPNH